MAIDPDIQPFLDAITTRVTALENKVVTPIPPVPPLVVNVTTPAELINALLAANSPRTIRLAKGNYGDLNVRIIPSGVMITSADNANPGIFNSISMF